MTVKTRKGRLSAAELEFVRENSAHMSVEEMAEKLQRLPDSIRAATDDHGIGMDVSKKDFAEIRGKLRSRFEFTQILREFTTEELTYFEKRYAVLMTQFKDDLTPTEETQLFMLIKIELILSRNLQDRKRAVIDTERLQKLLDQTYREIKAKGNSSRDDQDFCLGLENQLAASRAAAHSKTTEYAKMSEKHAEILRSLKSTRDQRIERINNSKVSFLDLIRSLADNKELAEKEGRGAGLAKLAAEKTYNELGQLHEFIDGSLDKPILSVDTVGEDRDAD